MAYTTRRCHHGAPSPPMALTPRRCHCRLLFFVSMLTVWGAAFGQLRYSIHEEMQKGSFVGNVALDLGMDAKELSEGGARVEARGREQYVVLNVNNGHLYINERIDRDEMCAQLTRCLLDLEIIVQRTLKVYAVQIEIQDINDNSPTFLNDQIVFQILENKAAGGRYALPEAHDPDVGVNSVQKYEVSQNKHFTLDVRTGADGVKYAELVIQKPLDREENAVHQLTLTATDGGEPLRSGTAQIRVNVLDVNDNIPTFNQSVFKISVMENVAAGSVVTTVTATDKDQGANAELTYSFKKITEKILQRFKLDSETGQISLIKPLDFEEAEQYEFEVQATDGESLSSCKVQIEVINENDNAPEITISSLLKDVVENKPRGTSIALLQIYDRDSGEYGEVTCVIPDRLPFVLEKSFGSYYSLVTAGPLDREQASEYNITITATDKGNPPRAKTETINLKISDENDNAPIFDQVTYSAQVMENVPPGASIFRARARDLDWDKNGKVTYSIIEGNAEDQPMISFISINSESGVIYALREFDFEELRTFHVQVKAQDNGSPSLVSNATFIFHILDQNDNTPEILYPAVPTDGFPGAEMAPRSSETGYLITKVVAIDADTGQNAWLSYHMLRSTEQGLFTVSAHSGEISTARPIMEKDAMKQMLVVSVKDNGQPPLSTSVTITIVLGDTLPEVFADVDTLPSPEEIESDLNLHLVIAVSVVSFLFLLFVILLLVLRLREWRKSQHPVPPVPPGDNFSSLQSSQFVGIDGVRAFLQNYSYGLSLSSDSTNSHFNFLTGSSHPAITQGGASNQGCVMVEDLVNVIKEDWPFIQFRPTTSEAAYDGRQRYLSNVILHKTPSSSTPST